MAISGVFGGSFVISVSERGSNTYAAPLDYNYSTAVVNTAQRLTRSDTEVNISTTDANNADQTSYLTETLQIGDEGIIRTAAGFLQEFTILSRTVQASRVVLTISTSRESGTAPTGGAVTVAFTRARDGESPIPSIATTFRFTTRDTATNAAGEYSLRNISNTEVAANSRWADVTRLVIRDTDTDSNSLTEIVAALSASGNHTRIFLTDDNWGFYLISSISTSGDIITLNLTHVSSRGSVRAAIGTIETFIGFDAALGTAGPGTVGLNVTISPSASVQGLSGAYSPNSGIVVSAIFTSGNTTSVTREMGRYSVSNTGVATYVATAGFNANVTLEGVAYSVATRLSNSNRTLTVTLSGPGGFSVSVPATLILTQSGQGTRGPATFLSIPINVDPTTAAQSDLTTAFTADRGVAPIDGDTVFFYRTTNPAESAGYQFGTTGWVQARATINGNVIVNGTVAGEKIQAGTEITGPIVTGGTLRTAASGARVQMSSAGFFLYNESGVAIVEMVP